MVYSFLRGLGSEDDAVNLKKVFRVLVLVGNAILYLAVIGLWIWNSKEWNLFQKNLETTKAEMWLEVEIVTVPVFLLYILLTSYIY